MKEFKISIAGSGQKVQLLKELKQLMDHIEGMTHEELSNGGELEGPALICTYGEYEAPKDVG